MELLEVGNLNLDGMSLSVPVPSVVSLNKILLFEIFEYLNVCDRKNVRLVCKEWYEVSNARKFRDQEAFFFCASYDFSTIAKIIVESEYKTVNLKLQSYSLNKKNSSCLWQTCGPKIKSLELTSCQFVHATLMYIMIHCPNMIKFTAKEQRSDIIYQTMFEGTTFNYTKKSGSGFDEACIRQNLTTLDFSTYIWNPIIYPDLMRISVDFPNLRTLKMSLAAKRKDLTHFLNLLKYLSAQTTQVDTLVVDFEDDDSDWAHGLPVLQLNCMRDFDLSKLKDVGMSISNCVLNDDSLNTILHYKFWTSLILQTPTDNPAKFQTFLIRLLKECPKLEKLNVLLKISTLADFFDVFPYFVKSRLKTLTVYIDNSALPETQRKQLKAIAKKELPIPNLPQNYTVRHLCLENEKIEGLSLIFVKYFPNVRHLKVSNVGLKDVMRILPELEGLQVGKGVYYCLYDAPIPHAPITSLRFMNISWFHFERTFCETFFPNLEYLSVLCCDEFEMLNLLEEHTDHYLFDDSVEVQFVAKKISRILSKIPQNFPKLRGFGFDLSNLCDESGIANYKILKQFFKSCLKLSEIRYIWVVARYTDTTFVEKSMRMCYEQIPSLRAVICLTEYSSISSYFDVFKNKIAFQEAGFHDTSSFDMYPMDYWFKGR